MIEKFIGQKDIKISQKDLYKYLAERQIQKKYHTKQSVEKQERK